MANANKDVHTEHCCAQHGCKYADPDCPVASGNKPQSYPCESCEWEKEDAARHNAEKDNEIDALRTRLEDTVRDYTNKIEALRAEVALERNLKADSIHALALANIHADRLADALRHQRWCRTCGEDGWGACDEGRAAIDLLRDHAKQPAAVDWEVDCRCIDCGGNQPDHDPTCSYMHELHGDQPAAVDDTCAVAAIQFALNDPEGMTFLRLWNEGEFETLRREWPEAPNSIYIGADPLTQPAAWR